MPIEQVVPVAIDQAAAIDGHQRIDGNWTIDGSAIVNGSIAARDVDTPTFTHRAGTAATMTQRSAQ